MKTFNLTWNETLKLNYRTFNHRCKFILHKKKEELASLRKKKKN